MVGEGAGFLEMLRQPHAAHRMALLVDVVILREVKNGCGMVKVAVMLRLGRPQTRCPRQKRKEICLPAVGAICAPS